MVFEICKWAGIHIDYAYSHHNTPHPSRDHRDDNAENPAVLLSVINIKCPVITLTTNNKIPGL